MTTSPTSAPRGQRPRAGGLVVMVTAVVLGILGMHGFDAHGVTGHSGHGSHPSSTMQEPHASHPQATGLEEPGGTDGPSDAGMLCVAMLVGAGGLLALALRRRQALARWRPHLGALRGRAIASALVPASNGPPPPWRFSVIRC